MAESKEIDRTRILMAEQRNRGAREAYALAMLLLLVSSTAALVLYNFDRHVFLYFGDAASHIVKARQFIDSQYPGIEIIGTVWLPLPHFLLVPFVSIDSLFYTGVAGPALGIPLLVGTGVLLFSIVRRITGLSSIAFVSACLFGLNPNIIYMALTPMNELSLFFFVTVGGYAFLRWKEDENNRWLLLCASAVMLASVCRYEAWILAAFVAVIAVRKGISDWKQARGKRPLALLAIALVSLSGVLIWLLWNKVEFGDSFQFMPLKYRPAPTDVANPMRYRQEPVFLTLVKAVLNVFGPFTLLACVAGFVRLKRIVTERRHLQLLVFFSLPAIFMFVGILTDSVLIDQWWWNWRFVLTLGLFLPLAGGLGLSEFFTRSSSRSARSIAVAALLIMPVIQLMVPSVSVATYEDATKIFHGMSKDATAVGERLGVLYKGGTVVLFTGSGLGERIMVSSGMPLKAFHIIRYPGGQDILGPIRAGDRYVLIGKVRFPDSREVVNHWLSHRETMLRHYDILLEDDKYILLERKSTGNI
jgi:hypothetical protein